MKRSLKIALFFIMLPAHGFVSASPLNSCTQCFEQKAAEFMMCANDQSFFSLYPLYCNKVTIQARFLKKIHQQIDNLFHRFTTENDSITDKLLTQNACISCMDNLMRLRVKLYFNQKAIKQCDAIGFYEHKLLTTFTIYPYVKAENK